VKDLVLLVADKDMEMTLHGLLSRPRALGIRQIQYDVFTHPRRDPGVRTEAAEFLRPYQSDYLYALVLFDHQGCGAEHLPAEELQRHLQESIAATGWLSRCEVVVIEPELEVWAFASSPHVVRVLAQGDEDYFQQVLSRYDTSPYGKPNSPKEAMERLLRGKDIPRSSSLYRRLAESVSVSNCKDTAFVRLRDILQRWFAQEDPAS